MPGLKNNLKAELFIRTGCLYAAALLFNTMLGIHSWFPGHRWLWIFIPVPEAFLFGTLLRKGTKSIKPALTVLPFFIALSAGEAFFRHIYRRPFDPIANLPLASRFAAMFLKKTDIPPALFITAVVGGYILLVLLLRLLLTPAASAASWCSGKQPDTRQTTRKDVPALILLLAVSFGLTPFPPLLRTAGTVIEKIFYRQDQESNLETIAEISEYPLAAEPPGDEQKLSHQPDIHLFIVESYGMTVFTNNDHRQRILPFLKDQESALHDEGLSVLSSGYLSTTFGGTSWLADASILSGLRIDSQEKYDRVIKSGSRNIIHFLNRKGYATVLSAPGTSFMTEKYLDFYSYKHLFLYDDFGYEGPYFTFGEMPDQYHLFKVKQKLLSGLKEKDNPVFVEYILCSSHVPWNYIPPYLDSWDGFDSGKIYFDRSRNSWYDNSWVSGSELFEGYDHSIRYSLETVIGYIIRYLEPQDIAVIIGDHQPKFPVSEKGADFSVPVHIVTGNETFIKGFSEISYRRGIIPPKLKGLPSLEQFLPDFLRAVFGEIEKNGE
jgi:hypothetical protein